MKQLSLICTLFVTLILSINTHAQAELTRISPANNAMLMAIPETIDLEFSQNVTLTQLVLIHRMNQTSVDITFEPSTQAQSSYRLDLPTLEVGTYLIEWSILGTDDNKISGSSGFMLHSDGVNVMDMSHPMSKMPEMPMDENHQGH